MATLPHERISPEEYLRLERAAETKSEYDDGVMYLLPGGSMQHSFITVGVLRTLANRLPPTCRVASNDMKIRVLSPTRYFYPDASVVCGKPELAQQSLDILINPLIVFEVLSDSTEQYDRGRKFLAYQSIDSLQEYVLVSQHAYLVEHFRRDGDQWVYTKAGGRDASLKLAAANVEIPLSEIYYQVEI